MQETKHSSAVSQHHQKYQTLLTNRFETLATSTGLTSECENVTSAISETAMEIAGQSKPQKPDKLSAETKQLREKKKTDERRWDRCTKHWICGDLQGHKTEDGRRNPIIQWGKATTSLERQQWPKVNQEEAVARQKQHRQPQRRGRNNSSETSTGWHKDVRSSIPSSTAPGRLDNLVSSHYQPPMSHLPQILPLEVRVAIKRLKRGKAPGEDNITTAVLQDGREPIIKALTQLFNRCLSDGRVPQQLEECISSLDPQERRHSRHKKLPTHQPSTSDLQGVLKYPPRRMLQALEQHQPARTGSLQARILHHWTTFMLLANSRKKANEYKIPLCFAFLDYEKAFDSIEFTPLFTALANQRGDPAYITILRDLYNGAHINTEAPQGQQQDQPRERSETRW